MKLLSSKFFTSIAFGTGIVSCTSSSVDNINSAAMNDLLLEKATPLKEFEAKHVASGGEPFLHKLKIDDLSGETEHPEFMNVITAAKRELWSWWSNNNKGNDYYYYSANQNNDYYANVDDTDDANVDDNDVDDANDDDNNNNDNNNNDEAAYYEEEEEEMYYDDDYFQVKNMKSFQGYSLKYATCQKVQRFSVDAVKRGEYSSLVSDDIVVLRLCPSKSCSAYAQYGCSAGYGEYAMTATEYMTIVMKYQHEKSKKFCSFCASCAGYYNNDDGSSYNSNTCYAYSNQCKNANCNNDDDSDDSVYLNYLNYFGCQKVNNNNGNYFWVTPYCDTSSKISMGLYYDQYCTQFVGNDIDISYYLDDFDSDLFSEAQEIECLSCGESKYPPYYNAHNLLCNNVYKNSGRCDSYLAYDLGSKNFDDDSDDAFDENQDEIQCSYIESIRYGTYDSYGEIYVSNSQEINQTASVTGGQKFSLALVSMICVSLALYSCYLHHTMTNLLLKSLSSGLMAAKSSKRSYGGSKGGRSSSNGRGVRSSSNVRGKRYASNGRGGRAIKKIVEESESSSDEYSQSTADSSTFV